MYPPKTFQVILRELFDNDNFIISCYQLIKLTKGTVVALRPDTKLKKIPALSFRHMRHFITLAETLSFRHAADALGITSSALSQSIAEAERLLEVRLFDRQGRQVQLSAAGIAALPMVTHLINNVHNTIADIAKATQKRATLVHIGLVPSMASRLMKNLEPLQQKHPNISFQFYDMPSEEIVPSVEIGKIDLGIGVAHAAIGKKLETALLTRDRIVALIRKDDELAGHTLTWAAVSKRDICHFVQGNVEALAGGSPMSKEVLLHARYQVCFTETLFALVRSGFCIGVIPENTARELVTDELLAVPITAPLIDREMALIRKCGLARTEAVMTCYNFLKNLNLGLA